MSQSQIVPRPKIHVFNELPHIYEIDDMMAFCKKHERLYICGAEENQEYLLKYFDICGIKVDGYTVTNPAEQTLRRYRKIPIVAVDDVIRQSGAGIVLAVSDRHYRHFIPKFREAGFSDYFAMTEYNKRAIANQLKPRPIEEMTFEINIADHCNMSCQMCDHYSQLAEAHCVDPGIFERDITRMGEIFDHKIACITLLGGEPTLHPRITELIKIARRAFPSAELIILTNGLLLLELEHAPEGNIWSICKEYDVHITVTVYPLKFDYGALERKAGEYGVPLAMSSNIHAEQLTKIVKISDKHTFDPAGKVGREYCVCCLYFNKFNVLKDGRYYMCPVAAHIGIFNKAFGQNLTLAEADSLDIEKVDDWKRFAEFSANYVPFCRYCDLKNWRPHSPWKASTKSIEEYI
ncbi:MAG: radical SAM protein [Clostridiales Family XIII bacterium]|jgi:MoaA/NifB/PqqE/SkfB family radical SAM enzyme|nr:radical SAM protein [Clostridiales Family XIII bacterium]